MGPGLPSICHVTWTLGSGACSPVLPTWLHRSTLWAQRCQNGQRSGDGARGCIFRPTNVLCSRRVPGFSWWGCEVDSVSVCTLL